MNPRPVPPKGFWGLDDWRSVGAVYKGLGLRVWGVGFRIWGLGLRVWAWGFGLRVVCSLGPSGRETIFGGRV